MISLHLKTAVIFLENRLGTVHERELSLMFLLPNAASLALTGIRELAGLVLAVSQGLSVVFGGAEMPLSCPPANFCILFAGNGDGGGG